MHPWSYAADTGHTVFFNSETGTYFELNHMHQSSFIFCPQTERKSKTIDTNLIWKYDTLSPAGLQLLQRLKAKRGLKEPPMGLMGVWSTVKESSLTAFSSSSNPNNKIIPTMYGFVYFGTKGSLIIDQFSERYTSTVRAKELLDSAIAQSSSLRIKRQVENLKVAFALYPLRRLLFQTSALFACSQYLS